MEQFNPEPYQSQSRPGFLELVYGVLFEPVKTMRGVAGEPPLGYAVLVVTITSLLGSLMTLLILRKSLQLVLPGLAFDFIQPLLQLTQVLFPLGVVLGLIWSYVKWFFNSAVLHLAAELLGGTGGARGVFAAAGLAGLPSIFMFPLQFLSYRFGAGGTLENALLGLAGLGVGIWSLILLVVGVQQAHGLTTGRSLLAVLVPYLAAAALFVLTATVLAIIAATLVPAGLPVPGRF